VATNPEAAKAAAEAAAKSGSLLRKRMLEREALQVLNFPTRPKAKEELQQRFETYFAANDPGKGGRYALYLLLT